MPEASAPQIRLAIVNDFEIVVAGVAAMLGDDPELVLVDLDDRALHTGSVDVVLFDNFAQRWHDNSHLEDLVAGSLAKVVVFTWTFDSAAISRAYEAGASGYLSKGLSAAEIITALKAIHQGHEVTCPAHELTETLHEESGAWPGQADGLTPRESEILAFITAGLTNEEIAAAAYLSINSVKTYIRTAYRKLGLRSRSQAVRYGMQHGFEPERTSAVT